MLLSKDGITIGKVKIAEHLSMEDVKGMTTIIAVMIYVFRVVATHVNYLLIEALVVQASPDFTSIMIVNNVKHLSGEVAKVTGTIMPHIRHAGVRVQHHVIKKELSDLAWQLYQDITSTNPPKLARVLYMAVVGVMTTIFQVWKSAIDHVRAVLIYWIQNYIQE